ncbi:hypothetical protein BKG85_12030 [Mycobacteroides chelonae]|nr:hypothetical protein BKG85_12030 [Mycobacteroides chelonae]
MAQRDARNQIVGEISVATDWYAHQSFADVLVSPDEGVRTHLSGKIGTAIAAGLRDREAPALPANSFVTFVQIDLKAALDEFVRGG